MANMVEAARTAVMAVCLIVGGVIVALLRRAVAFWTRRAPRRLEPVGFS